MRNKQAFVTFVVVGALVAFSGIAAASDDTVFNYGYDEDNHLLLINTTSWEDPESDPDCQFDSDLEDEDGTSYELDYTFNDTTEVDDVTVDDTDCELEAIDVTGPAGQINHGMFLKAFNLSYDGTRRGCLVRHLAQSDLGMGDQQVNASDPEADPEFEAETSPSTVEFFSAHTDCENGPPDDVAELSNGNGRPEWAGDGRPEFAGNDRPDSPGKSGSAPGRGN